MAAAPAAATPIVETKTQTVARLADPPTDQLNAKDADRTARKTTRIKVGAKATLRGIAWRVGERSPSDLQRMMIALFRANPSAFDGNINRLHLGAVLTVPSFAEVAAISKADAKREFHVQMAAWHSPARVVHATPSSAVSMPATAALPPAEVAPVATAPVATAPAAALPSAAAVPAPGAAADTDKLNSRVQSLEHELADVHGLLESQRDTLAAMQQQVATAEKTAPMADASVQPEKSGRATAPIVAGIGLLAAALAALYFRLRRRTPKSSASRDNSAPIPAASLDLEDSVPGAAPVAPKFQASEDASPARTHEVRDAERSNSRVQASEADDADTLEAPAPNFGEQTHPLIPVTAAPPMPKRVNNAAATISRPEPEGGTTVNLRVDTTAKLPFDASRVELTRVDTVRLDYNFVDLDMTAQHVQMPSVLNEHAVVKERRTNLADVLRMAIEREPDRHDLRMKLLELYYSAAATNRQAFLEVVQKFARDRDYLHADQWEKIASMGRQIAGENAMFAEPSATDDGLADCA
jgi:pilus assembly protein FimV